MRAAGRIHDRLVTDSLDLIPRALAGVLVLGVHREVRHLSRGVEPKLNHLPVAFVQPGFDERSDQVVIVVEVKERLRG